MVAPATRTFADDTPDNVRAFAITDSAESFGSPFVDYAETWRAAGWVGVIPLPFEAKNPPPVGWTGRAAGFADDSQVQAWAESVEYAEGNIGLHLGWPVTVDGTEYETLGIDVDHYRDGDKDKRGGDQLADLAGQLGPLPATYVSTARALNTDGSDRGDWVSGIRLFLVPRGLAFRGQAAKDIEVIQKVHRFAVVWPSINPKTGGTPYRLFSPEQWASHGQALTSPPDVTTLPVLPDAWIDHLTQGRMRDDGHAIDMDSSVDEIQAWYESQCHDGSEASACDFMRKTVRKWKSRITDEATSHDKVRDAHWEIVNLGAEGCGGWSWALSEIDSHWIDDVMARSKRGAREMRMEMFRSRVNALRKVKAKVESPGELAAVYLLSRAFDYCAHDQRHYESVGNTMVLRVASDSNPEGDPAQVIDIRGRNPLAAESADHRRNTPLDLRQLRTVPPQPISWLLPDVLARDSYVSLSAAPGTGKSVLTRAIAVEASLGRSAFDPAHTMEPARVIYLDAENGQDWWRAGLDSMAAPLDLPNLSVVCYPDVGGLDTAKGAREFLSLITDLADGLGGVDLVVFDTVSRFIDGGENDADTWSQFYRLAIQPLRDQQVAVLRLDHLGKDADKGPRGSSHKLSDVDADFRMTAARVGSDDLTLTLGKRRRQHFAQVLTVRRKDEPLRHEINAGAASFVVRTADGTVTTLDPDTKSLVADLDQLGVNVRLGRERAQAAYTQAGGTLSARASVWAAALRFRKERDRKPKPDETEIDTANDGSAIDVSK